MYLVAGSSDPTWFIQSGKKTLSYILDTLNKNNVDIRTFNDILDFGCGCGRIIRHLPSVSKANLYGTDYNAALINWCRNNLKGTYILNDVNPPLPYADGKFDFVYAWSVFTHFHEDKQTSWLNELSRVIRSNGYLWFSFAGRNYMGDLTAEELVQFQQNQIVVHEGKEGSNWCCAYYSEDYVKELARKSGLFKIVDIIAGEKSYTQDYCLLQRKA
jgi:SAM-dependent methyltransferase